MRGKLGITAIAPLLEIEYLVVGGGGSGGAYDSEGNLGNGGGGGGGGVLAGTLYLPFGSQIRVEVGAADYDSSLGDVLSLAGGVGGDAPSGNGAAGGSGGGGAAPSGLGGAGTAGQGSNGQNASGGSAGAGGGGTFSSITGEEVFYGGGGLVDSIDEIPANRGFGGHGGGSNHGVANPSAGVVIIAYPDTWPALASTAGLSVDAPSRSGYRVYRFTSGAANITLPAAVASEPEGGGGGETLTGLLVADAGTSAVNGTYCPDGTSSGKTKYTLAGTDYSIVYEPDYFGGGVPHWAILDGVNFVYEYEVSSSADTPPLTGWAANNGSAPAPTLSAASCP